MELAKSLRAARVTAKLSQQDVADRLGVSKTAVSKWESGAAVPERHRMPLLARLLGLPVDLLRELAEKQDATKQEELFGKATPGNQDEVRPRDLPPVPPERGPIPPLPVYGSAMGGPDGAWVLSGDPVAWNDRDSRLVGVVDAFACYVQGESMVHAYEPGNLLLVKPGATPVSGDDILLVRTTPEGERYALIKRLVRANTKEWTVKQLNPAKTYSLPRREWQQAMLVIGKYNRG